MAAKQKGMTLLEVVATISVMAILAAVAVPGLASFIRNNRVASQTNTFIAAISLARSEAVTRGTLVSLCPSSTGTACSGDTSWSIGWLLFIDANGAAGQVNTGDAILSVFPPLSPGASFSSNKKYLQYDPSGFLVNSAGASTTFQLRVNPCSGQQHRDVVLSVLGRPSVSAVGCS